MNPVKKGSQLAGGVVAGVMCCAVCITVGDAHSACVHGEWPICSRDPPGLKGRTIHKPTAIRQPCILAHFQLNVQIRRGWRPNTPEMYVIVGGAGAGTERLCVALWLAGTRGLSVPGSGARFVSHLHPHIAHHRLTYD